MKLVTHADCALGKQIVTRLLCDDSSSSEPVRAHISARHPTRTKRLEQTGAEVVCGDLYAPQGGAELWSGVSSVVHASASGVSWGREAVVSISDFGIEGVIGAAERVQATQFVLLHPPSLDLQARLAHSPLPYTLLYPKLADEVAFLGGTHGRLLERRRQIIFMPLPRVVDAAVFAAAGGLERMTLRLPTQVRRYSDVLGTVEQLLRLPKAPVADLLLAELLMGPPFKLVTPGVARALGLEFPGDYLREVFSPAG